MNIQDAMDVVLLGTGDESIDKMDIIYYHMEVDEDGIELNQKTIKRYVEDFKTYQEIKKTRKEDNGKE